jgi:hypothetical protein
MRSNNLLEISIVHAQERATVRHCVVVLTRIWCIRLVVREWPSFRLLAWLGPSTENWNCTERQRGDANIFNGYILNVCSAPKLFRDFGTWVSVFGLDSHDLPPSDLPKVQSRVPPPPSHPKHHVNGAFIRCLGAGNGMTCLR